MYIGKSQHVFVVEPLEVPVPRPVDAEAKRPEEREPEAVREESGADKTVEVSAP